MRKAIPNGSVSQRSPLPASFSNTTTASKTDLDANCAFWDKIGYNMPLG